MRSRSTRTTLSACAFLVVGACALLASGVVAACARGPSVAERALQEARATFVAGDYAAAQLQFRRAVGMDLAATLGVARSHHQLHEYEAALLRYERALELEPNDSLAWVGYLSALAWGGILEGNGTRLETALASAPAALHAAPENVEIYEAVRIAAAELNRLPEYAAILELVAGELSGNPVLRIELAKARIEDARRASNAAIGAGDAEAPVLTEITEALESSLRAELDEVSASVMTGSSPPPGVFYLLAVGYDLLGEAESSTAALESLERTEEGRRMAAPLRYRQFLNEWIAVVEADTATRLEVTERWLPRFEPQWSNDHSRNRAILGMQFDLLVAAAREAPVVAGDDSEASGGGTTADQPPALTEQDADRIAIVGRRLARIDTWGGASHYVETASVLARTPSHYVTAVVVTEDGIEALREDRAGLIYPGTPANEREQLRLRYLAVLMQLQGQALHNLERDDEAEEVLREAIALHPVAASYAVLGGLLLDQDRGAEAFDLFVAALAHGFSPAETMLEEQTRASALEAAAGIGASADVIDAAVGFAAERFAAERDREIIADPLDTPAPDFELDDTAAGTWRLSDLAGKVVVLNYWATWCGPCIAEMPYYQQLVDEYAGAEDVVFLAISTDSDPSVVAPFIEKRGHTFTVLYDQGSAVNFHVTGTPASFVIGKDGLIKYRTSGFPGPERYLNEMGLRIEALLAAQR